MARSERIAFVCPRFLQGGSAGGAETLLRNLAGRAARAGRHVEFLTTCATDHFTWKNDLQPGARTVDGLTVRFFPVNENRDLSSFLSIQDRISRSAPVTPEEEQVWLRENVNSQDLVDFLAARGGDYDRLVMGPYLFGLIYFASRAHPRKTLLVPCLHDEPFARLSAMRAMFTGVRACLFNTQAEMNLACRLYGLNAPDHRVVGMGIDPFEEPSESPEPMVAGSPYMIYCGRRETLKGTPLLLDYFAAFRSRTGRRIRLVLTGSGPVDVPSDVRSDIVDLGFVSEERKRRLMAGAVAFCHPSTLESFGIVIMEAWLASTAVLVHAGSDVLAAHCRQSGGGLWFREYTEFEEELALLMDDPDLRSAMAQAGRRYVMKDYSWDVILPRLLQALDEA